MGTKHVVAMLVAFAFLAFLIGYPILLHMTTTDLQDNAIGVGNTSQKKITTDLEVTEIYAVGAENGRLDGGRDNITMMVRLGAGSETIDLTETIIRLDTNTVEREIVYTFREEGFSEDGTYTIRYLLNGSQNRYGFVSEGDLAQLQITLPEDADILETSRIVIRVVNPNGVIKPIDITLPAQMSSKILTLY